MSEVVAQAWKQVSRHGRSRIELWDDTLHAAITSPGFLDDHAPEVAALAAHTLGAYHDRASQRAVERVVEAALGSEAFLKHFTAALVKAEGSRPHKQAAYVLLRWSGLVLRRLEPEGAKKAVARLIECQGTLLAALSGGGAGWAPAQRVVDGLLRSKPPLYGEYLEVAKAKASAPLARAVYEHGGPEREAALAQLLAVYVDKVLGAKERPAGAALECWRPVLAGASLEQLSGTLLPAASRMAKRSPDPALAVLAHLLSCATPDLSGPPAAELFPTLLQQARHAKEPVRQLAVDCVRALAGRLGDPQALAAQVAATRALLDGTAEGKIKAAVERVSLCHVLAALAAAPGRGGAVCTTAVAVSEFLCAYYKDELSDDGKAAAIAALGAWLPKCAPGAPVPEAAVTRLEAGLKEKELLRRAHLRALAAALRASVDARGQVSALVPGLGKVVGEGVAKAAVRLDGLLALLAASYIAGADMKADSALEKDKVWAAALKPDSVLLAPATAAKLAADDAALAAELAGVLLVQHGQRMGTEVSTLASRTLTLLLLHHSPAVRKAAQAAAAEAAGTSAELAGALVAALAHWAAAPGEVSVMSDSADAEATVALVTVHRRYLSALTHTLPPKGSKVQLPPAVVAQVLLLAHHPLVAYARRGRGASWEPVRRHVEASLQRAVAESPAELVSGLLEGIRSAAPRQLAAGLAALRSAMAGAAAALAPVLLPALRPLLDTAEHDALTTKEIRILYTPEGKLANEAPDGSIIPDELYQAQLAAAGPRGAAAQAQAPPPRGISSIPRVTHQPAAAKPSTAAKAAPVRPSAAGAGSKPAPHKAPVKDAAAEARERQLGAEAQVRARVAGIRDQLSQGLGALGAAAAGAPAWAAAELDELSVLALPLLTSPLVGEGAAFTCVRQLAGCLPGALGRQAADVASALRVTRLEEEAATPDYQHLATQGCVRRAVHALRGATASGAPLPGPAYMFCFPILRAVLSCPEPTPLHEDALAVVALHVGPAAASVPRPQSFALLYHVLEIIPAYRDRVQPLLRMLCTTTAQDDVPGLTAALQGLVAGPPHVRAAALHALFSAPAIKQAAVPADDEVLALIWLSRCDPSETNAEVAEGLWEESGCELPPSFVAPLLAHLRSPAADVRAAAADALALGAQLYPEAVGTALAAATGDYAGQPRAARLGTAALLHALAGQLSAEELHAALDFLLGQGLADPDQDIRDGMVAAGKAIVDAQGQAHFGKMLPLFESYLEKKAVQGLSEVAYDHVRQGAVVFLGTLARHMDPANPKLKSVVGILVEVLTTPSESVQRSVSDCLPPLMQPLQGDKETVEGVVKGLLDRCLKGKSYGDRRGAAFGLAGVVKGLGIGSLKGYGVMEALKAGVENKNDADAREGALCAFECLSEKLGRLFEPYVIHILPMLLVCFGDAQQQVRDAANAAANAIMAQLSGQGVKLVLPALLKGLEDRTWRTKQGSIQLLGAMAHCAPKQLSTCLPTIVPRLGEVLSDPHPKVGQAARQALDEVGSVIRNPEISALVPTLLAAIADPNAHTKTCLDTLLSTVFINTVDAPSLALVIPVIHRGLRDRSGDVKKRAARIVGNLCALINDPKDMQPYVGLLLPELQAALIDPLPEVRATAAKALGSLVGGMGEEHFGDVLPWLLEHLRSEASAVERSGAAQGLAEVLAVQAAAGSPVDSILTDILAGTHARNAAVREGHLTLFRYLPRCMPDEFQQYLPEVLPCILDGLADEAEGVRDAALSAGRIAVELYANSALPLLLPTVEAGITNGNWRIRQSSVELLGDLLFKVAGTTGRIQQDLANEEEEGISVEAHGHAIVESLGWERRNEVLARVYMARSDVAYSVRSASLHVWKTVVTNTPKTLGEVLPALMEQIIQSLADPGEDRRQMAGRCLGELVRKMGDRILAQIVPILKQGMVAESAATRQGVCNGLKEVLENATRHQIAEHLAELLPAIQGALCDPDPATRQAAGGVFNVLFKSGGGSAMESVIPALLQGLESERHYAQALEGLRVVLGVRPQLLGVMIPKLIKPPVHSAGLRALGALAEVAGAAIHGHLQAILPPLLQLTSSHPDTSPTVAAAHEAMSHVVLSVQEDGLYLLVSELVKGLEDPAHRKGAAAAVAAFCRGTRLDFQEHVPALIGALVPLLAEEDADAVQACWEALGAVTSSIPKEMQPSFVRCLKDAVATARDKERRRRRPGALLVPGFCLPKALSPVLPIYLQGVLQGSSAELRELAAEGLGELVEVTGEDALKPFVVQITGPLIRIIGDRFPWEIKAAILHTLGLLIAKAGPGLKPFAPQLQTTFLKCLTDPAQKVRAKAAANLGELSRLALRLDQLVADLAASATTAEPTFKEAYLAAVKGALLASGDRLSGETLTKVAAALQGVMAAAGDDEVVLGAAAAAQGALAKHCSPDELRGLLASGPLSPAPTGRWGERLGSALTAAAVATHAADRLESVGLLKAFVDAVRKQGRDERGEIKSAAARAAGRLILYEQAEGPLLVEVLPTLVPLAVALLGPDQDSDVQRQMMAVLRRVAGPGLAPFYKDLVPSICSIVQDSAGPTKLAAERTLGRVLQLDASGEPCAAFLASGTAGPLAKTLLTEAYTRRLSRLPPAEDEDAAYAF